MMTKMLTVSLAVVVWLTEAPEALAQSWRDGATYLQLVSRLDRPQDGYCFDVLGAGQVFRTDLPLNAHNCKPGVAPDGVVQLREDGSLYFPAYDLCVTAFGVNRRALPGSVLLLRGCGADEPFLPTTALQSWEMADDGRLRLAGSDLCVTAGPVSDTTFSLRDQWRTLALQGCETAPLERSQWQFLPVGG